MENTNKVLAQTQIPIKKTKTIVICWQQYCYNMHQDRCSNFWGIGDIIRGTVACYQICKRYNNSEREVNIIVDTHKHPVGKLLKNNTSIFSNKLDKMGDYVPFIKSEDIIIYLERALINSDNDTVFFMTNANAGLPLKNDEKEFMKKLLEPGEHLSRLIDKHGSYLPKEYSVHHYRLGDNELVRNETYNNIYWGLYTKLVQNYQDNDVLFSDTKGFKDFIKEQWSIKQLETNIGHLGIDKDENKIIDTMVEFFIISKSTKIKTYSVHNWGSGFVKWIAEIYDIPLYTIH